MLTDANIIATNISKGNYLFNPANRLRFDNELAAKSNEGGYRIIVFNSACNVVNDSNKTDIGKTYLIPEVINTLTKKDNTGLRRNERVIYAAASILNTASDKIGAVLVVSSADEIYSAIEEIEHKLFILIIVTCILLVVLVFFISQLIIEPLKKILRVIEKMSMGYLNQRIDIKSHDEFFELAKAFNAMTEKLEQVDKTRGEFVSNVSHELKTPLSAIKVLSESMLTQDSIPQEIYKEFLSDINSEIDRMTNIVNDLLTLVKLDQNHKAINVSRFSLNKMLENIVKRLNPLAIKKQIHLEFSCDGEYEIDGDEMKLTLAISNLVDNGIKYTAVSGNVLVKLTADNQNYYITVADNGIGINEAEQSKIFDRFYRTDKTRDRETGGTGLGLAITRSAIMLHNGNIDVKSDNGTTFIVTLPQIIRRTEIL